MIIIITAVHWRLFLPLSCSHHEVNSSESVNPVPTHYATPLSQLGIRQILQKILFHTVVFVLVRLETKVLPESKMCITKKTHLFIHHIQEDDNGLHETVFVEVFKDIRVCDVTFGGNSDPVKGGLSDDEWQKLVL